jgi:hypothetical protein
MQYFLYLDNEPYYQWQLDLMVQSFEKQECTDKLIVALTSKKDSQTLELYNRGIKKLKNVNNFENMDELKEVKGFNKLYSLYSCLFNNIIKESFFVLDNDVVLYRQPSEAVFLTSFPECVYSVDPLFTLDFVKENIGNEFLEAFNIEEEELKENWCSVGGCYGFSNIHIAFISMVIENMEKLSLQQILKNKEVWSETPKVALCLSLFQNKNNMVTHGQYLTVPANSDGTGNFISYKSGVGRNFYKSMFSYNPPMFMSFGNPFESLANAHQSENVFYISNLATEYIKQGNNKND